MAPLTTAPRDLQPELMDDPSIDPAEHRRALNALRRLNRASDAGRALWHAVRPFAQAGATLRVLDLASGGGDVACALHRAAQREGASVEVVGADVSATAVEHAQRQAGDAGPRFVPLDVLHDPLPDGFDVIINSLFLHHLTSEQVVALLRRMGEAARRGVAISDLRRGPWCRAVTWLGTRLMTRSRVVHVDSMLSVTAAFTIGEISDLAGRASLAGAVVRPAWPGRYLLTWSKA